MNTNTSISRPAGGSVFSAAPAILAQVIALLLTIALGSLLVALLVFSPQAVGGFLRKGGTGWPEYRNAITQFFSGLLRGQLLAGSANRQVWQQLGIATQRSLVLIGISVAVALPLGMIWGGLLATVQQRLARALLFGLNALAMSLPSFAIMLLAMEAVANFTMRTGIQLTYVQGYGLDRHLLLPAGVLSLRGAAYLARAFQIAHEDILQQDWIRAARARGLGGLTLWRRHVLPALRLPMVGILLGMLRVLVNGLIIVDYMYGWGGLGRRLLTFDIGGYDQLTNTTAMSAALVLVIVFVLTDAIGQLALRYSDPRLRELNNS